MVRAFSDCCRLFDRLSAFGWRCGLAWLCDTVMVSARCVLVFFIFCLRVLPGIVCSMHRVLLDDFLCGHVLSSDFCWISLAVVTLMRAKCHAGMLLIC